METKFVRIWLGHRHRALGESDKQARHVRERCIDIVSNTYFLVPFYVYCSEQLIHCLNISGNKNNLRTI